MSWLFESRILFNVQGMLVYTLIGLFICWNIYLQITLRRNNYVFRNLLNNVTPPAPQKPTPPITETRPNLRTEATLAVNIPSPKPESMLNLSGAVIQVNSNNKRVSRCQHKRGQHTLLKPELVIGPKLNQQNQLARLVSNIPERPTFPHPSMILTLA